MSRVVHTCQPPVFGMFTTDVSIDGASANFENRIPPADAAWMSTRSAGSFRRRCQRSVVIGNGFAAIVEILALNRPPEPSQASAKWGLCTRLQPHGSSNGPYGRQPPA